MMMATKRQKTTNCHYLTVLSHLWILQLRLSFLLTTVNSAVVWSEEVARQMISGLVKSKFTGVAFGDHLLLIIGVFWWKGTIKNTAYDCVAIVVTDIRNWLECCNIL